MVLVSSQFPAQFSSRSVGIVPNLDFNKRIRTRRVIDGEPGAAAMPLTADYLAPSCLVASLIAATLIRLSDRTPTRTT